jgi:hypothetical protein
VWGQSGRDDRPPVDLSVFELLRNRVDLCKVVPGGVQIDVALFDQRDEFLEFGVPTDDVADERELAIDQRLGGLVDMPAVADDVVVTACRGDVGRVPGRLVGADEIEYLRGARPVGDVVDKLAESSSLGFTVKSAPPSLASSSVESFRPTAVIRAALIASRHWTPM